MRLDIYCAQYWPEQSRSTWQKLIKNGSVRVNGEVVDSPKYELGEDDYVQAEQPKTPDYSEQSLPVVYEDDNVIVINKPVGVLAHSKGALNDEFTVADFFRSRTTYHLDTNRPGIIHRLDRDTSGIMIGAKTPEAGRLLAKQFQDKKAKKIYQAVLDGIPKEPKAVLDLPIGRNPKHPSQFRVDAGGKSAETYYEIEQTGKTRSLARLEPRTGRTHQLRVHMAYIGTPIRGDVVYGKAASRLFLHARSLEITIAPGTRKTFTAPVPDEFLQEIDL